MKKKEMRLIAITLAILSANANAKQINNESFDWDYINISYISSENGLDRINGYSVSANKKISEKIFITSRLQHMLSDEEVKTISNNFKLSLGCYDYIADNVIGYTTLSTELINIYSKFNISGGYSDSIKLDIDENIISLASGVKFIYSQNIDIDLNLSLNNGKKENFIKGGSNIYYNFDNNISIGLGASFSNRELYKEKNYMISFKMSI